jgi:chaperonin cofactor prefoldin
MEISLKKLNEIDTLNKRLQLIETNQKAILKQQKKLSEKVETLESRVEVIMKSSSPNFEFKDIKVHVSAMKNAATGGKISFLSLLEKHAPLVKKDCW